MATTTLNEVKINKISSTQFETEKTAGNITQTMETNEVFIFTDDKVYTQAEKTKLSGVATGADVSTITGIKKNGTTITPTNKVVDISIPTKVSDLTNDSGFISSYTETDPTVPSWAKASSKPTYTASEVGALASSLKGATNGLAELDSSGKVPTAQLPSYVDDVLEYNTQSAFPATGEIGKIYVDKATNKTYRWSGSSYVEISASLALGETSATAYRGDRGKTAYDHSQTTHAPSNAEANVIETVKVNNTALTPDANKAVNVTIPVCVGDLTNDCGMVTDGNYVHTDNNYTTADMNKLAGVETGAEVNIIESVKVNGTALSVSSKAVDISVPTAVTRIWS